ncbi:sulfite exporter TauE/SafE family protein [Piscirickettsia litoralis]|uniref:Probable membrane transporter protein n=1 Tax=Piscirickettsia litoralis TaxID=1891921 RepID=A0ABX3A642_9GAMM|nr:sulfite exporter TauE/SafE family protein [Piscirickettsia litoralis]ODN43908.1 sulfite transporter TauE/SafE [Piscirickettsia litoralis]
MIFALYLITGAIAGVLSGLLGIGGGLIMVPLLTITLPYYHVPPEYLVHVAVATSLVIVLFNSALATYSHARNGNVLWKVLFLLTPFAVIGIIIGGNTANYLSSKALLTVFTLFLTYTVIKSALKIIRKHEINTSGQFQLPNKLYSFPYAIFVGAASSLLGIGAATTIVPFLRSAKLDMVKCAALATSLSIVTGFAATLLYIISGWHLNPYSEYATGYIYWPAVIGILIGATITVPLGTRLGRKLKDRTLAICFLVLLIIILIITTYKLFALP